jgi:hypothetical protein
MKKRKIVSLFLLSFCIYSYGQIINISNTRNLLSISKSKGLISALDSLDWYPIHYIDRLTTNKLLKQTMSEPYSYEVKKFLLNLTLNDKLPELSEPINHLIYLETKLALKTLSDKYEEIDKEEMPPIVINSNTRTENYLNNYYKTWLELAKKNRANYILGKSIYLKNNRDSLNIPLINRTYDLMRPYKICNYNCYIIMLTLKKMGSSYVDDKKLSFHKKIGEVQDVDISIFKYEKGNTFLKDKTPRLIKLNKGYKTIKDIDFANELNFKNKYLKNMNSDFGIYGFYNKKLGIINICHASNCDYYLVKLIGANKLQIYKTTMYSIVTD